MSVCGGRLLQFAIVTWVCLFLVLQFLHAFFKSNQSGFGQQHKRPCICFIHCIYIFVKNCMTVSIWLYNEFSSRNILRREQNGVKVQMLTLSFIFDNKCPLPWICDDFHRQKTFCTKDFLFFIPSWFLILYFFPFLSFCLIS